jgi:hypothetical protein
MLTSRPLDRFSVPNLPVRADALDGIHGAAACGGTPDQDRPGAQLESGAVQLGVRGPMLQSYANE